MRVDASNPARIRVQVTEQELDACAAGLDAAQRRDEIGNTIARLERARKASR